MLGEAAVQAILGTARPDAAKAFYGETLGLKLVTENEFGFVFAAGVGFVRLAKLPAVVPSPHAVLGFFVMDIAAGVEALKAKGVKVETFPFIQDDARGIWTAPDGTLVMWFRDPDGNLLSLTQHVARP
jgi:catechol 2,3-dioxygenase-like lactoylglutathione lyase family enzyme